jgi:2-amino-4-hydroxy-6-hydroxymethyldihydropteridine diphosphokinase
VVELRTTLQAHALLRELLAIEAGFGRQRGVRNAPRTLDLDLLAHGDLVVQDAQLTLPHPRAHLRAFVLEPLAEIDPGLQLPGVGPIASWRARCAGQRIERLAPEA